MHTHIYQTLLWPQQMDACASDIQRNCGDVRTGSAYAVAGPWWASKLGKSSFAARQCSKRGGDLHITVSEADGRVDVAGGAVVISEGRLFLD